MAHLFHWETEVLTQMLDIVCDTAKNANKAMDAKDSVAAR